MGVMTSRAYILQGICCMAFNSFSFPFITAFWSSHFGILPYLVSCSFRFAFTPIADLFIVVLCN